MLAGIVIASVLRLVDPRPVLRFWKLGRVQFATAAITYVAALVLAPRLDLAVVIGVGVATLVHLWRELHIQVPADYEDGVLHVRPSGVLYFASAPGLEDAVNNLLAEHPGTERLRVDLDGLGRLDVTGAMALQYAAATRCATRASRPRCAPCRRSCAASCGGCWPTTSPRSAGPRCSTNRGDSRRPLTPTRRRAIVTAWWRRRTGSCRSPAPRSPRPRRALPAFTSRIVS